MSSAIFWNLILIVPFLLAFIGIPLWMTVRHADGAPDHTAARPFLAIVATPQVSGSCDYRSLTWDRGKRRRCTAISPGMPVFHCGPHSPWRFDRFESAFQQYTAGNVADPLAATRVLAEVHRRWAVEA